MFAEGACKGSEVKWVKLTGWRTRKDLEVFEVLPFAIHIELDS